MTQVTEEYLAAIKEFVELNSKYLEIDCWVKDEDVEKFVRLNVFQHRLLMTKMDKFINAWPEEFSIKLRAIRQEMQEVDVPWL